MPRTPRLDHPGARHHVMNRGIRKTRVFLDDADRERFLRILEHAVERFQVRLHAYAVMGNHYHLLVAVPHGNLSAFMQYIGLCYARYANDRYGWDGPLWRGRFHNRLVEGDGYWRHLFAYVHLNPVRAGLVDHPDDARWTSHRALVGLAQQPQWLDGSELVEQFGTIDAYRSYLASVLSGDEQGPEDFDPDHLWAPPSTDPAPKRPREAPIAWVVDALYEVTGRPLDELVGARGDPELAARRLLATWCLYVDADLSQAEVARLLEISRTAVGARLQRFERRRGQDPALMALLERWRQRLLAYGSTPQH